MCPIAHVPHPSRYPISIFNITHDTPLPICPIAHVSCYTYQKRCQVVRKMSSCQKDVKKMSSCQKDVKCQKVKHMDYGGGSQKNKLT